MLLLCAWKVSFLKSSHIWGLYHTTSCYYLLLASGADTQTHRYIHTYTHTLQTRSISRNQLHAGLQPSRPGFKMYWICPIKYAGMCPQWSAVVGTDHHSEKIATTQIKQPPLQTHWPVLKYQHEWKCLVSITSWFTQHIRMYIHSVCKESSRHYLSIETKDYKFWEFKTHLYSHYSSKPGHITEYGLCSMIYVCSY